MKPIVTGHPSRRPVLLALAVAVSIGAVAVTGFMLGGAGGASDVQGEVVLAQESSEEDAVNGETGEIPPETIDVTFDVFLSRDPFEPVLPEVVEEPDPTGTQDPTDPSDPGAPGQPTDPAEPGLPSKEPTPEVMETTTGSGGSPVAIIRVGTTTYEVAIGEVFGDVYRLIGVDGDCATWLHGDSMQSACVGDTQK